MPATRVRRHQRQHNRLKKRSTLHIVFCALTTLPAAQPLSLPRSPPPLTLTSHFIVGIAIASFVGPSSTFQLLVTVFHCVWKVTAPFP